MKKCLLIACHLYTCFASAQTSSIQHDVYNDYNYDNFVITEKATQSNGDNLIKHFQYPKDLASTMECTPLAATEAAGIQYLVSKNIVSTPVESYSSVLKQDGSIVFTGAELITFYNDRPYPKAKYELEIQTPISDFHPYYFTPVGCAFHKDTRYVLQESYTSYDNYGNLLEVKNKGNQYSAFLYSYKGLYKIATVINSSYNKVSYSSFETSDKGNWVYDDAGIMSASSIAGQKCFSLVYDDVLCAGMPTGDYILSFWMQGYDVDISIPAGASYTFITGPTIDGWKYVEYKLTNTTGVRLSGYSFIDEVRMYPKDAQMETAAYQPLVGVSYSCDIANRFTYYTYDDLGRLVCVKDQNGNVIKKMEYGLKKIE